MNLTAQTTVGTIATEYPLATRVFARHGIDFCCGGGQPLEVVCTARNLEVARVLEEIEKELEDGEGPEMRWDRKPLPVLIAHILDAYHAPLKEELPRLETMAHKVHSVHGDKEPALAEIRDVLLDLRRDLDQHMMKEERVLFPMILNGQGATAGGPVSIMEQEHEVAGKLLRRLRELTRDFEVPADACNTWRALWAGLAALERDLHEHIHLENNILHKRALAS